MNNLAIKNSIPSFNERNFNDENAIYSNQEFYRICPTIINESIHLPKLQVFSMRRKVNDTFFFKFIEITSIERQMELLEQYTADQSIIDWKSIFEGLQEYRRKAIEQSMRKATLFFIDKRKISFLDQYEQLLWTELYRPKTSQTYLGNHTKQIKRLHEWFSYWRNKLQNEQPKKILPKKRKHLSDDDDDEDFTENSSKYSHRKIKESHFG